MIGLVASAAAIAAPKPGMVQAAGDGLERCPADRVFAWRKELSGRVSKPAYAALLAEYDRAVAEWAVCAHTRNLESWKVPTVESPAAAEIVQASILQPGSRQRTESIEAAAAQLPNAAAILALEDLQILGLVAHAEPEIRLDLVASVLGGWGCPDARMWMVDDQGGDVGLCPEQPDLAVTGLLALSRLFDLAGPTLDPGVALNDTLEPEIAAWWATLEGLELYRPHGIEVALPGAAGRPLDGSALVMGTAWQVTSQGVGISTPELVRVENGSLRVLSWRPDDARATGGLGVPGWTEPFVFAESEVDVVRLAGLLQAAGATAPRFVGQGPQGLVVVDLGIAEAAAAEPGTSYGQILAQ